MQKVINMLAEVKESIMNASAYENDKVDIKGSVLIELSRYLYTTPNYLLGYEKADEDEESELAAEMLGRIKDEKIKALNFHLTERLTSI